MIDLYTWTTPNGRKVSIALEEMGLDYQAHAVDIGKDEQFDPGFLRISPNNKIPAIVDRDTGLSVFESGAILLYLAKKSGKFLPEGDGYWKTLEWLMWQMGGFGPMLGQAHHFLHFARDKAPYAQERYAKEAQRLYKVLDTQLRGKDFIVGDYSIADMAVWPWCNRFDWQGIDLAAFPDVLAWYRRVAERPAVQKGYQVPRDTGPVPMP